MRVPRWQKPSLKNWLTRQQGGALPQRARRLIKITFVLDIGGYAHIFATGKVSRSNLLRL
jgi:hypothetical protein